MAATYILSPAFRITTGCIGPKSVSQKTKTKTRTRTGCNTCRRRRIKCDEARPSCSCCTKSQLSCNYQLHLIWEQDLATSGKCHGRSGVWSKSSTRTTRNPANKSVLTRHSAQSPLSLVNRHKGCEIVASDQKPTKSHMFVNVSIQEMQTLSQLDHRHRKDELCLSTSAISSPIDSFNDGFPLPTYINGTSSPGYTPSMFPWSYEHGHEESFLLSYYQDVLCAATTVVDDNYSNPLRRLIMPMTAISELVYNATLMVAAHYLQLEAPRYRVTEMSLRQRTLSNLRQVIVNSDWTADEVLLAVMMLCSLDISYQCDQTWLAHLTFYRAFLMRRAEQTSSSPSISSIARYVTSYFSSHTVLAKTLYDIQELLPRTEQRSSINSIYPPCTSWTATDLVGSIMPTETLDEIDLWNGYSNSLLLLINEIAGLKYDVVQMHQGGTICKLSRVALETKILRLRTSIDQLSQSSPVLSETSSSSAISPQQCRMLEAIAETYQLAALLFLNESSTPAFLGISSTSDSDLSIPLLDDVEKQNQVRAVLNIIHDIVHQTKMPVSWPLWALFIAGCCADQEEDRVMVLSLLHAAQQKAPYENIPQAQKVIELVWNWRDSQLERHTGGRARSARVACYDWEAIMDLKGWRPSFA
ncbi:hypothetical protein PV10_08586 [Exophiala mesophila]|uniref:Zn(2)-C6 fungal-type domain-containing protein n=1 Tax=Exophiala mesophila TaxID=212818 RepID=A0A0D1Z2G4_EXOME|nr:uncharacterized protein PV10_08586 [Exophiala mesophila]KIV88962.1 hypothetical protein PV10_08586 [Exophiala mesophila]